jgi:hypothetical protein
MFSKFKSGKTFTSLMALAAVAGITLAAAVMVPMSAFA